MSHVSEPRLLAAQPNIQDVVLNSARRDRVAVTVHLLDGRHFEGRIKNFDKYAVVVEVDGADQLVFKHAIMTLATERSLTSYLPSERA
jgi:host factor-I protein